MRDLGLITEIEPNGAIKVIPLLKDTCVGCTSTTCAKGGRPFYVSNPKNFEIEKGDNVKIVASKKHQIIQAFVNLILPITLAVLCYIFLDEYTNFSAGALAGISLLTFFVLCLIIVFIVTKLTMVKSEIAEVI